MKALGFAMQTLGFIALIGALCGYTQQLLMAFVGLTFGTVLVRSAKKSDDTGR